MRQKSESWSFYNVHTYAIFSIQTSRLSITHNSAEFSDEIYSQKSFLSSYFIKRSSIFFPTLKMFIIYFGEKEN